MKKLIGVLALAVVPAVAAAAEKPDWAFPVTEKVQPPPRFEASRVRPAPSGSTLSITRAKADDMYDIPNWFPTCTRRCLGSFNTATKTRRCARAAHVICRPAPATRNPPTSPAFRRPISFAKWRTGRAVTGSTAPPW